MNERYDHHSHEIRLQRDLNPGPSRFRYDSPTTELRSHPRWQPVNFWVLSARERNNRANKTRAHFFTTDCCYFDRFYLLLALYILFLITFSIALYLRPFKVRSTSLCAVG